MFRAVQRCGSGHGGGGLKLSSVILELFSNLTKKNNLKAYERKDALLSKGLPYIFPCAER